METTIDEGLLFSPAQTPARLSQSNAPVWKTLSVRDAEFRKYLDGGFSSTHRALPVRSCNVGTTTETVTFNIVRVEDLGGPSFVRTVWLLARPQSLILSAGPMLATLGIAHSSGLYWNAGVALATYLGVLFFHVALNFFNDYGDHVKGRDRMRTRGGSRVIQNGWIAAKTVRRLAWASLVTSLLFGLPALLSTTLAYELPLVLITVFAGLVGAEFAFQRLGLKYHGWAEVLAFALTGPLLTSAFAWALTGQVRIEQFWLGCFFGSQSLLYFHAVNFENIMADSQAGVRTWATRAGFDSSQKFFYFCVAVSSLGLLVFCFSWLHLALLLALATHFVGSWILVSRVSQLASPLSSKLTCLRRSVLRCTWATSLAILISLEIAHFFFEPHVVSEGSLRLLQDCGLALTRVEEDAVTRVSLVDQTSPQTLPLSVDFLKPQILHRLKHGLRKGDPLPRALGLKSLDKFLRIEKAPYVLDATAGLGVDSFFIAAHGARVRAVERSEIIFELLRDGERRLREVQDDPRLQMIAARLSFEQGEAFDVISLLQENERPDVIYLDPMYPHESRTGSALPKKAMQIFRRLIAADDDAGRVFEIAREKALERVVVKRPLHAEHLGGKPDHTFQGKTARYDMYLKRGATGRSRA